MLPYQDGFSGKIPTGESCRQKLTLTNGINKDDEPCSAVLSLNRPSNVNESGRRIRLTLARPSQSKANSYQIALNETLLSASPYDLAILKEAAYLLAMKKTSC